MEKVVEDTKYVMEQAYQRRNISSTVALNIDRTEASVDQIFNKWAWWSLNAGNVATSRKYAIKAIVKRPYYLGYWRTLFCALRGY